MNIRRCYTRPVMVAQHVWKPEYCQSCFCWSFKHKTINRCCCGDVKAPDQKTLQPFVPRCKNQHTNCRKSWAFGEILWKRIDFCGFLDFCEAEKKQEVETSLPEVVLCRSWGDTLAPRLSGVSRLDAELLTRGVKGAQASQWSCCCLCFSSVTVQTFAFAGSF